MDKYISRENLLKRLELVEMDNYGFTLGVQMGVNHAIQCVKEEPAVDVVEVRHAKWKYFHKQNKAVCTSCSFERDLDTDFGRAIACPNCGARMDKEDKHEAD